MSIYNKSNILVFITTFVILIQSCAYRTTPNGYIIKENSTKIILKDKKLEGQCKISGKIYSRPDENFINGANITFNINKNLQSDKEGNFEILLVPGEHNIIVNFIGHSEFKLENIKLASNEHLLLMIELGTTAIY